MEDSHDQQKHSKNHFKAKEAVLKALENDEYLKEFQKADTRKLPKGFEEFAHSDLCSEFVDSIRDYCEYLLKIDMKKTELERDARQRKIPVPQVLQSELDRLNAKAKRMADNYGRLIFQNRSVGQSSGPNDDPTANCNDRLQFRTKIYLNKDNDNAFFQAVVKLFAHSLRSYFVKPEMERVESEIDRLFKTNVFNVAQRNQEKHTLLKKYPALGNLSKQEFSEKNGASMIDKLTRRAQIKSQMPNFKPQPAYSPKGEIRPLFVNLTPYTCQNGRSPLISLMFPTIKDKITSVNKLRAAQSQNKNSKPTFLHNSELELIIRNESIRKQRQFGNSLMIQ